MSIVPRPYVMPGIGVDLEYFSSTTRSQEAVRFTFVGRLLKEKGVIEFLEAGKKIVEKWTSAELLIVGGEDSSNPGALRAAKLADRFSHPRIKFVGEVESVKELLSSSSVFVLPSYREGMPRSTIEASAVGLPVITTDVPGCRDSIDAGVNGLVIPPRDAGALSAAMDFFMQDRGRIIRMGAASRARAENLFDQRLRDEELSRLLLDSV